MLQKYLTREHHKLVQRFIDFKARTQAQINRLDSLERIVYEFEMKDAVEFTAKEAMYAMDSTNPLQLYDCLVPEITAYRPLRILTDDHRERNNLARLKLAETELKIVSRLKHSIRDSIHLSVYREAIPSFVWLGRLS